MTDAANNALYDAAGCWLLAAAAAAAGTVAAAAAGAVAAAAAAAGAVAAAAVASPIIAPIMVHNVPKNVPKLINIEGFRASRRYHELRLEILLNMRLTRAPEAFSKPVS